MKYLMFAFIFSTGFSCRTQKHNGTTKDQTIVYIIPPLVEKKLASKINPNDPNVFVFLSILSGERIIYFTHYKKSDSYANWIENTNRKVLISGVLYPLIFESDQLFASTQSSAEVIKHLSAAKFPTIKKVAIVYDGDYIKFNGKGEILENP